MGALESRENEAPEQAAARRIRRLRYRLRRQGMLELDAWLAELETADWSDPELVSGIERLLEREPPELIAMMRGDAPVPRPLRPWLRPKR